MNNFLRKSKKMHRIVTAMLAVLIMMYAGTVSYRAEPSTQESDEYISDDYTLITQSGGLSLYAKLTNGDFFLGNANGNRWYSSPIDIDNDPLSKASLKAQFKSLFYIYYVDSEEIAGNGREQLLTSYEAIEANGAEVSKSNNGVNVTVIFSDIDITVPISYELIDGHLEVSVDVENIKEGERYQLMSVALLPGFGAGNWYENGYLFVPDGCGALINFNNQSEEIYDEYVYGDELSVEKELNSTVKETIHLPVFGSSGENSSFFAVITDGAASASITASSGNSECGYNTVSSRFNLRILSSKMMFGKSWSRQSAYRASDIDSALKKYTVRYYPLSGENTDYMAMASVYRNYLTSEKGLTKNEAEPTYNFDLIGAIDVKANFLGFTYYKPYALTTYSNVLTIVDELKKSGIESMTLRYLGWGNDGLQNNKIPKSSKSMRVLGSKKSLNNMLNKLSDENINIYLDVDFVSFNKGTKNAAKTIYNEVAYQQSYMYSVYASRLDSAEKRLLSPSKIFDYTSSYLKSFSKLSDKISLSSLTNTVYSDFDKKVMTTRCQVPELYSKALKQYVESGISIEGDSANDYAVPYVEKILNTPVSCSGFRMEDAEIPFYQLVFRGYLPMSVPTQERTDNPNRNYLKAVQTGCELLWTGIYEDAEVLSDTTQDAYFSTTYSYWIDDAAAKYSEYMPLLRKIGNSTVSKYYSLTEDVSCTVFDNGVKVYVNFGNTDYVLEDGTKVSSNGFVY